MGKLIIEKWQCDRCGVIHAEKPPCRPVWKYTVKIDQEGEWSACNLIDWRDMCESCHDAVGEAIKSLRHVPVKA